MAYEKISIEEFGKHLLVTNDLDPIYVGLNNWSVSLEQKARWMVAYWCLYHAGVSTYLSTLEGVDFWKALQEAAHNDHPAPSGGRWPRGSERRHWRGQQAVASLADLVSKYDKPEQMVEFILTGDMDYKSVANRVQSHRGFGPWIAFKVCDMVDRVMGQDVNFDQAAVFMFKDPVKGAIMLWRQQTGNTSEAVKPKEEVIIPLVVDYLTGHFDHMSAPPLYDRPVGLQEVETILCKWKSHMNGHYPLSNDVDEIQHGLREWGKFCQACNDLADVMPSREKTWSCYS